ncbi:MAG: DUF4432 family protein [Armatimonadota bacterium]|nr:DUF4432 family protein [Armatimonadota bacterium]
MLLDPTSCLFSQGQLNGWKTLTLENHLLRVTLLPEKGSDIVEFLYKPLQLDYLWKSPIGLVEKPAADRLPHDQFMDYYEGGWQEILPSGGFANSYSGVDYGLHGELWSLPWNLHIDQYSPGQVSVVLDCRLTMLPLSVQKRLTLRRNEAVLHIDETLTNESDQPVDFMWGHHPALGAPFLNGDCVLDAPATECEPGSVEGDPAARLQGRTRSNWPVVPDRHGNDLDLSVIPPPAAGTSDEFWLTGLREGWCAVTDTKLDAGFGLAWDLNVFQTLWVWQELGGLKETPWSGNAYVMAVEPWSSYPLEGLAVAAERGTHLTLPPRGNLRTWLKAVAYVGIGRVARINADGTVAAA